MVLDRGKPHQDGTSGMLPGGPFTGLPGRVSEHECAGQGSDSLAAGVVTAIRRCYLNSRD